jgi:hypothetical protein
VSLQATAGAYQEFNQPTQQAPLSTANAYAADVQTRILIELQVISYLLMQQSTTPTQEDLSIIRRDMAAALAY